MDDVEADNIRHKEEERRRREKRRQHKLSKSDKQRQKEQLVKEHVARVLKNQQGKSKSKSGKSGSGAGLDSEGGSSEFKDLFAKRAEGYMVDLNFRNACPRPPVGPCLVGRGLDGENQRLSRYRDNDVEKLYVFKLHGESDLGVPLTAHAIDVANYKDPKAKYEGEEDDDDDDASRRPKKLHPEDEQLLNWEGSTGDTAAEELQISRDRKRAESRAIFLANGTTPKKPPPAAGNKIKRLKKDATSRVLDEATQSWMKKTTYLANDPNQSVHRFTSLAKTKKRTADEIEKELKKSRMKVTDPETIEKTFDAASQPNKRRKHPTKKNLTVVYDLPLLPDVTSWGHTFTHVVIDKPPKALPGSNSVAPPTGDQLRKAFVTDVSKNPDNNRMNCSLIVPDADDPAGAGASNNSGTPTLYKLAQRFDLDVSSLKEDDGPYVNFLLIIDPHGTQSVMYHPLSSRVSLSSGRPASQKSAPTLVSKKPLDAEDTKDIEIRTAEVDVDLAEKHRDSGYNS